jgi:uncharacterized cupredoxin-like copper-binding protein
MRQIRSIPIPMAVAVLGMVAGCSSESSTTDTGGTSTGGSEVPCTSPEAGSGTAVGASEQDFTIELDTDSVKSGSTTFTVDNAGPSVHEFVVFQTDLSPDALPQGETGDVDEEGEGVTHLDEIEDIGVGCTATLSLDLDAGSYVVICNLPGHYAAGMHAPLTVK